MVIVCVWTMGFFVGCFVMMRANVSREYLGGVCLSMDPYFGCNRVWILCFEI